MKNRRYFLLPVTAVMVMSFMNSCLSTDIMEPRSGEETGHKVVINLSAPEAVKTRAGHEGYKLRYVAKLYAGTDGAIDSSVEERQELIEGEKGSGGVENQLVFNVPQDNKYIIYVFADYIPENSQPTENGYYKDYFYNTTADKNVVVMMTNPGNKNSDAIIPESFFNNDNYDCFAGVAALEEKKTSKEVKLEVELHRIVSKIRLVDTSKFSGIFNGKSSSLTFFDRYTIKQNLKNETGWNKVNYNKSLTLFDKKNFLGDEEQELFFFYSFASIDTSSPLEKPQIQFSVTDYVEITSTLSVSTGYIEVRRNCITTVKGRLLPGLTAEDPSLGQEETRDGPIILDMSTSKEDWENMETTWTSN